MKILRSLLVAPLALAACQPAKSSQPSVESAVKLSTLDAKTTVATFGPAGTAITAEEMDKEAATQLKKLNTEYTQNTYETRRSALEGIIIKKLVADLAKAANLPEEQFFQKEVEGRAKPATDAEIKEFFDKNQDKMRGAPFDAMKGRIGEYLLQQKRQEAAQKYMEELKTKNNVKVLLAEPEQERFNVEATGPSMGPADAKVTIVEFSDFQCPFCSKAKETVDQVMAAYKGKVRLVFRDYPLPFHDQAGKAAEAGLCANDQNKFWVMHDHMFANQGALGVDALKAAAKEKGLDAKKFDECLDSGKFTAQVAANTKAGADAGVQGTPHFFINGRALSGAQPFERFKEIVDAELARANN